MVLKEVTIDFTSLYICVSIVREKPIHYSLFTIVRKVQHCTGYPLIQVEIVSVCKSHYMRWLASQSSGVDFLVPGVCGRSLTVSSVGAGGAGAGMSSAISSLLSKIYNQRKYLILSGRQGEVKISRQNCAGQSFYHHYK